MKDKEKTWKTKKTDWKKTWIKRKTDWLMDYLAEEVLSVLKEQGFHEDYILNQRRALVGKNRFAVLLWCQELEPNVKAAIAKRLGIDENDFNITLKTLAKL